MKNALKLIGIIAIVAIIGFSFAAASCGGDDSGNDGGGGGGSGGTFTLTDIPAKYNGKYAFAKGSGGLFGAKSIKTYDYLNGRLEEGAPVLISNGKLSLPMWESSENTFVKYSGDDYAAIGIIFYNDIECKDDICGITFPSIKFSNGSDTKSWNNATIDWEK